MKQTPKPLWQVSLSVPPQAEDAVAKLLATTFHAAATSYFSERTRRSKVSVFLENQSGIRQGLCVLVPSLLILKATGLLTRIPKPRVLTLEAQDWAESWKRHFKPFLAAKTFYVKPSWITRKPSGNAFEIVLDPGLSFGTGHHPTTRFCLDQIARLGKARPGCSVMDLGCGSGILAIAAGKLGCRPIRAIDFDPVAISVARNNAATNQVADKISFARADVTKMMFPPKKTYDLVCANLLAELLEANADRVASLVAPGGFALAAGILTSQFPGVQRALQKQGLRLRRRVTQREWTSGTFAKTGESRRAE